MAHLGGEICLTIKDAIKKSTGSGGLISTYQDSTGKLFYFLNGRPCITIKAPKKEESSL